MGCGGIDVLVLTHPDADHVGSAVAVMNTFPVNAVWDPMVASSTKTWQNVVATIEAKGINRWRPLPGETQSWNGVITTIENPPNILFSEDNNNSIVLVESLGSQDVLLLGDTEKEAQQYMMSEQLPSIELSDCFRTFPTKS
jgi:beta-lactamase superfamily II metal-dependent hydrolase